MTIQMKLNKEDSRGIRRSIAHVDMPDIYSMCASSLVALDFLKYNKSKQVSIAMGYQLMSLKTLLRTACKSKANRENAKRLPLGTLFWGKESQIPQEIRKDPGFQELVGEFKDLIALFGTRLK